MARAAAVTKVPATPTQTTGPAALRNRCQPICIPPSNRMTANATDTTRWTVVTDNSPSAGTTSEANAAATRRIAGARIRIRSLIRLSRTAAMIAAPTTSTSTAKCSTSLIVALPRQGLATHRMPRIRVRAAQQRSLQPCGGHRAMIGSPPQTAVRRSGRSGTSCAAARRQLRWVADCPRVLQ